MDRELPFRISGFSAGPLVGRVVFILDFKLTLLLLCCNALQVLCWDEDTLGAPEQFCRYFFSGAVETVLFWWCVYYAASLSTSTTARCWLCLIVSGRVPFLTRHIHPEMNEFVWPATDGHSPNPGWPRSLCHWAAPRYGEGPKTPGQQCQTPPARAYALWHLLFFWIWTREQVLVSGLWEAGLVNSV